MKRLLSTLLVTVFLFSIPKVLLSQYQANNWYFGNHAGLSFNNSNPVPLNNGAIITSEGCTSISDSVGNLLFYTDGTYVYNSQHNLMPNGSGLAGHSSSTQSAIILKKPGSTVLYYVFTIDYNYYGSSNGGNGFRYSIVDLSLNGGLGDVTVKNILLRQWAREKLTAVLHRNGSDFWVLINDWIDDNIHAYRLSCSGVNPVPIVSNVGSIHNHTVNTYGYLKASPQNNKIALATYNLNSFIVLDFDNSTGIASNRKDIKSNTSLFYGATYGVEFSPDGNLLYGTTVENPKLFQFNLNAGNGVAIANSAIQLAAHSTVYTDGWSAYYGALQLGKGGKIYSANWGDFSIGVINNPNIVGIGCNYANNAVSLNGRRSYLGLPNIFYNYILPIQYDTVFAAICSNNLYTLPNGITVNSAGVYITHLSSSTVCDSVVITKLVVRPVDTTDLSIPICNNQMPYNWYGQTITQAGTYYHSLTNRWGCDSVIQLNVSINPSYKDSITQTICQGDTLWGQTTTGYYTRHFQTIQGCDSSVTVHLLVNPVTTTYITDTICQGESSYGHTKTGIYIDTTSPCTYRRLTLTVLQSHTDTLIRIICRGQDLFGHKNPGKYLDTIGPCRYRFLNLSVDDKPVRLMPTDTVICEESSADLNAGQYPYIKWQNGSTNSTLKISKAGSYSVTVGNKCDTITFSCTVRVKQCSLKIPNAFSPNGDGINDKWVIPQLEGNTRCRVSVFDRYGQSIFISIGYKPWDGMLNGKPVPIGTYYYIITYGGNNYNGSLILIR